MASSSQDYNNCCSPPADVPRTNRKPTDSMYSLRDRSPLPHIVGYYELESTKAFPKDAKSRGNASGIGGSLNASLHCNPSVEHLRSAIVRLTLPSSSNELESMKDTNFVPLSWVRFVRHLESIVEREPMLTCLPLSEVVAIARSFDVSPNEAYQALIYFERRGHLFVGGSPGLAEVCCAGDESDTEMESTDNEDPATATKTVVISISWLFRTIGRVLDFIDTSVVREREILAVLAADSPLGRDLDRQLTRAGLATTTARSRWLLGTLRAFDVCVPVCNASGMHGSSSMTTAASRIYMFPALLESGSPTETTWPETPNCDEKQVTCEAMVRHLRPGMFAGLQRQLASAAGMSHLAIISSPPVIFMSHHIIFSTALDCGSCADCFHIRRRSRLEKPTLATAAGRHGWQR
jgi:hypothetical protein